MTRRLLGAAYRTYPEWWRDRYGEEAREVAEQLAGEGRSPVRLALDVAGDALRCRLRRVPEPFRPPARAVLLQAAGRSLSSGVVFVLLMGAALLAAEGAVPSYGRVFLHPTGGDYWAGVPGLGFVLVGRAAVAVGAGLFVLAAAVAFGSVTARAARARDWRGLGLLAAATAPVAFVPVIAYGAVQIAHGWAAGPAPSWASTPQLFAMILADQHAPQEVVVPDLLRPAAAVPATRGAILCAASWLLLAAVAALAIWATRRLRRRVGLPTACLRAEAVLGFGAGLAMLVAWVCLIGWGLSLPAAAATDAICTFPGGCRSLVQEAGVSAVWWTVVCASGLAGLRSLLAGNRAMRQLARPAAPPATA